MLQHDTVPFLIFSGEKHFMLSPLFKLIMTVDGRKNEETIELVFNWKKRRTAAQNVIN